MVSARNLFRSVPARLKFMRSPRAENAAITRVVEPYVLSRPDIHLILSVDGEEKINAPVSSSLSSRSSSLFGAGSDSMVEFSRETGGITVRGQAQPPGLVHGRGKVWLLVNGRPVEDRGLRGAMIAAYGGQIPRDMFPDAVIHVLVPPDRLDVNVHPAKSEVRFADPYQVREALISALHSAFRSLPADRQESIRPFPDTSRAPEWGRSAVGEAGGGYTTAPGESGGELPWNLGGEGAPAAPAGSTGTTVIGQVLRTYIVAHDANGLFLVDQHAAHEKVIYERIAMKRGQSGSQQMLIPATIDLTPAEAAEAEQYRADLEALGFEFDSMGGRTYVVRAIPSQTAACANPGEVFRDLLREKSSSDAPPGSDDAYRRFAAGVACKMAVKAGDFLDIREMEALLSELSSLNDPRSCPHGRPTMVEFTAEGLARMFKRT
jgi:DNA mismatch repair protein MutL